MSGKINRQYGRFPKTLRHYQERYKNKNVRRGLKLKYYDFHFYFDKLVFN
jgi:hypothetical protein